MKRGKNKKNNEAYIKKTRKKGRNLEVGGGGRFTWEMTGDDKLKSGCGAAFSVGVDVLYNEIIQDIIIKSFFSPPKKYHFKKGYY